MSEHDTRIRGSRQVSIPHLVVGLVFLGIVAVWALVQTGVVEYDGQRWVLPLVLVVAGAVGLLVSVVNAVRRSGRRGAAAAEEPGPTDDTTELFGP